MSKIVKYFETENLYVTHELTNGVFLYNSLKEAISADRLEFTKEEIKKFKYYKVTIERVETRKHEKR